MLWTVLMGLAFKVQSGLGCICTFQMATRAPARQVGAQMWALHHAKWPLAGSSRALPATQVLSRGSCRPGASSTTQ